MIDNNYFLCILVICSTIHGRSLPSTTKLDENRQYSVKENASVLHVFCSEAQAFSYFSLFKTIYIEFKQVPQDYSLFEGSTPDEVHEQYAAHIASWIPLLPWRTSTVVFPSFQQHCVGISASDEYTFEFVVRRVNYWKFLQLTIGVTAFFAVPSLVRNACFHYSCGVSLGVLGSVVLLVYILGRLLPRKTGTVFVVCGWSLTLYFFQVLWSNVYNVLREYKTAVAAYITLAAFGGFTTVYIFGPPKNQRLLNTLQWFVQGVSLVIVFMSSEIREATMAVILIMLTVYNFPAVWTAKMRTWWRKRFPPQVKLLTEEEYLLQADVMTRKSVQELREFCSSPDCNAWKLMSRLRDPVRFSKFVQGGSHLEDSEILDYETDMSTFYTDNLLEEEEDSDVDIENDSINLAIEDSSSSRL